MPVNFSFDRVFDADSTQEDIFEELEQLITSVCDGFNVCIFAYGQPGSRQTFSMEGPSQMDFTDATQSHHLGLVPRSLHKLLDVATQGGIEEV